MRSSDAILRPITTAMVKEAEKQQAWFRNFYKNNATTRAVTSSRDIIGDLAHQVVENLLDEFGITYQSTRKVKYESGDELDMIVAGEAWDIKGTKLPTSEFFIFDKQLKNPKLDVLDNFCFVQISRDETEARIFSLCPVSLFKEKKCFAPAGTVYNFQYDNWGIALFYLPSFKDWFMKQPASVDGALALEKIRLDNRDYNRYNMSMANLGGGEFYL